MIIAFKDEMGYLKERYPISSISMETDDKGLPVDIVIKADDLILQDIAEKYGALGFNNEHKNEALYGRLKPFIIIPFEEPEEPEYIDW